jgi:hypothetical protein
MDTAFAWKVIESRYFSRDVFFSYGNSIDTQDLSDWDSVHEDLDIKVNLSAEKTTPRLDGYLYNGENAAIVLKWVCDEKFTGTSREQEIDLTRPMILSCRISKGWFFSTLKIDCLLVAIHSKALSHREWIRPPGSIISQIPIIERLSIGSGNWFPIEEFDGNGNTLIKWDFITTNDIDLSISSCFSVLIDKTHPFYRTNSDVKTVNPLINLLIIQSFARKLFNSEIFDQLLEREKNDERCQPGSLGAALQFISDRLCSHMGLTSIKKLKEVYDDLPEKFEEIIDIVFSKALIEKK